MPYHCVTGHEYEIQHKVVKKPVKYCYQVPEPMVCTVTCQPACDPCNSCCCKFVLMR